MALTTQKILVTGADGFIGSHLVEALLARKYGDMRPTPARPEPVEGNCGKYGDILPQGVPIFPIQIRALVHYNSFNSYGWLDTLPKEKLDKIDVFAGDIRDPNGVRKAMQGMDMVFHLAALIAIPFSYHSPDSYVDTNIACSDLPIQIRSC